MVNFTEEGLLIAISYLIPGFLVNILLTNALYLSKHQKVNTVFNFLFFSMVNMFIYTLLDNLWFLIFNKYWVINEIWISLYRNVLLPIILGGMLVNILKTDLTVIKNKNKLINKISRFAIKLIYQLGFDKNSMTATSWDYVFYRLQLKGGAYLIITLKSGEVIYGLFGEKSFASNGDVNQSKDLFLEETFTSKNFLDSSSTNSGVLIQQSDILTIDIDSERI